MVREGGIRLYLVLVEVEGWGQFANASTKGVAIGAVGDVDVVVVESSPQSLV